MNYFDLENALKTTKEKCPSIFKRLWKNGTAHLILKFMTLLLIFIVFNLLLFGIIGWTFYHLAPKIYPFLKIFFLFFYIVNFIILFIYLWSHKLPINLLVRCIIKAVFSIFLFFTASLFFIFFATVLSNIEKRYIKIEFHTLPGVYYVAEYSSMSGGRTYHLYEEIGFLNIYLKEVGISPQKRHELIFYDGNVSSEVKSDFVIRFSQLNDNSESAVFYYKPATGELISAENYNESWGKEYDDYEDIMKNK